MKKHFFLTGFSTIELMLALMLITLTLTTITLTTIMLPQTVADGNLRNTGTALAKQALEKAIRTGQQSFSSVISTATTTSGMYTSGFSVTTLPDKITKILTSTIQWKDSRGILKSISKNASITDILHALPQSCGGTLAGDWTHPLVSSFSMTPGNLLPSTFTKTPYPIHALGIRANILTLSVPTTINHTDANLFTFDISSTTHPLYLSSLNTSSTTNTRLTSLSSTGGYIFAANSNPALFSKCATSAACSQLQVFSTTYGSNLQLGTNFQLGTTTAPFISQVTNGQGTGRTIFLQNNFLYLGLQKVGTPTGMEFNILDIQNPLKPVWLGGYVVGRTINQIQVSNGFAYLATDDPAQELVVLDVRDPAHPTLSSSYNAPGNPAFGYGETVYASGYVLVLGRSYIPDAPQFALFSLSTSTSPVFLGPQSSSSTPVTIQSALIKGFLLFLLTSTQVQILDIHDPTTPVPYTNPITFPNSSTAYDSASLACSNNTLYIATSDSDQNGYLVTITGT